MEISEKRWKVHYKDTKDGDGSGILEMHPLCDVLASVQSCYTNTSLTSNIVGYKQKPVSCYDYWTSINHGFDVTYLTNNAKCYSKKIRV